MNNVKHHKGSIHVFGSGSRSGSVSLTAAPNETLSINANVNSDTIVWSGRGFGSIASGAGEVVPNGEFTLTSFWSGASSVSGPVSFSAGNGCFVVSRTGRYLVQANISLSGGSVGTARGIYVSKNGSTSSKLGFVCVPAVNSAQTGIATSIIVQINTIDGVDNRIFVNTYQTSGISITADNSLPGYFSITEL